MQVCSSLPGCLGCNNCRIFRQKFANSLRSINFNLRRLSYLHAHRLLHPFARVLKIAVHKGASFIVPHDHGLGRGDTLTDEKQADSKYDRNCIFCRQAVKAWRKHTAREYVDPVFAGICPVGQVNR